MKLSKSRDEGLILSELHGLMSTHAIAKHIDRSHAYTLKLLKDLEKQRLVKSIKLVNKTYWSSD